MMTLPHDPESIPYLSLSRLKSAASKAYSAGIETLLAKTLKSQWDAEGTGWQEQWDTAKWAGVYASCDGLLLLARANWHGVNPDRITTQESSTFHHHLALIFDQTLHARDLAAERRRTEAFTNTMKLAKFIQAAATLTYHGADQRVVCKVVARMYRNGRVRKQFWTVTSPPLSDDSEDRLVATGEALRALYLVTNRPPLAARECIRFLVNYVSHTDVRTDWRRSLIACWILSEVPKWLTPEELSWAASVFQHHVAHPRSETLLEVKMINDHTVEGFRDYFSYNPQLLTAQTVLNFLSVGLLGTAELVVVLPTVAHVIQQLISTGVYRLQHRERTFFWEFAQAMLLVDSLARLHSPHLPSELELMYITPKVFDKKDVEVQDNLCAILMPFEQDWSDDMLKVYQSIVKRKGMDWWRSDFDWGVGQLMQQIWEGINRARVIIADCTGRNPNVFYELGIAHTLGKDVFICTQDKNDIPFDLRHITYFEYNTRPAGITALKKRISLYLDTLHR